MFISTLSESAYAQTVPMEQMIEAIMVAERNPDLISFHTLLR